MNYIKTLKKRLQPERQERIAFMDWVRFNRHVEKYLFVIPNEGLRNPITGALLKRMGMVKGIPDYFFFYPLGGYHGLFIEFKYGNKKQTKEQKQFFEKAQDIGYKCIVVYSAKEAIDAIKEYLRT